MMIKKSITGFLKNASSKRNKERWEILSRTPRPQLWNIYHKFGWSHSLVSSEEAESINKYIHIEKLLRKFLIF